MKLASGQAMQCNGGVKHFGFTAHNSDVRWIPRAKGEVVPFIHTQNPVSGLFSCFGG